MLSSNTPGSATGNDTAAYLFWWKDNKVNKDLVLCSIWLICPWKRKDALCVCMGGRRNLAMSELNWELCAFVKLVCIFDVIDLLYFELSPSLYIILISSPLFTNVPGESKYICCYWNKNSLLLDLVYYLDLELTCVSIVFAYGSRTMRWLQWAFANVKQLQK